MRFDLNLIVFHMILLVSLCCVFVLYIMLVAAADPDNSSWWLLLLIFAFIIVDFCAAYYSFAFVAALKKFAESLKHAPHLIEVPSTGSGHQTQSSRASRRTSQNHNSHSQRANKTRIRTLSDEEFRACEVLRRRRSINSMDLSDAPKEFLCPITLEVMADPVVALDGLSYERSKIEMWFKNNKVSPVTREGIRTTLIPNQALKSQIVDYLERKEKEILNASSSKEEDNALTTKDKKKLIEV